MMPPCGQWTPSTPATFATEGCHRSPSDAKSDVVNYCIGRLPSPDAPFCIGPPTSVENAEVAIACRIESVPAPFPSMSYSPKCSAASALLVADRQPRHPMSRRSHEGLHIEPLRCRHERPGPFSFGRGSIAIRGGIPHHPRTFERIGSPEPSGGVCRVTPQDRIGPTD